MKSHLAAFVEDKGHEVLDLGTNSPDPVDYPDYAQAIGEALLQKRADRGILICGSGIGASVAANKLPGIRAGVCHDVYSGHQGVEHDDMNVVVMGARVIGQAVAEEIVQAFLGAGFTGEPRHLRRLEKVRRLEEAFGSRLSSTERGDG